MENIHNQQAAFSSGGTKDEVGETVTVSLAGYCGAFLLRRAEKGEIPPGNIRSCRAPPGALGSV